MTLDCMTHITLTQACRLIGIPRYQLEKLRRNRRVVAHKWLGRWCLRRSQVDKLVELFK